VQLHLLQVFQGVSLEIVGEQDLFTALEGNVLDELEYIRVLFDLFFGILQGVEIFMFKRDIIIFLYCSDHLFVF